MSWKHSEWAMCGSSSTGAARAVLYVIAHMANGEGRCWPSQQQLADRAGLSVRHVRRVLHELEEMGELALLRGNGRGNATIYRILMPPEPAERRTEAPLKADTGDTLSRERRTNETPKGGQIGTERRTNLSIKADKSVRAYKEESTTELTTEPTTEMIQSSSSCSTARIDDDDWPDDAPAEMAVRITSNVNSPQTHQQLHRRRMHTPAGLSTGAIAAAYSDEELRQAAWELGAGLGLVAEWDGYEARLHSQSGPSLAQLLRWMQLYADLPIERLDRIQSLTGVLRAHLARNEQPQLTTQQGEFLTRQIDRALTVRQLAEAKGYARTGVLQ